MSQYEAEDWYKEAKDIVGNKYWEAAKSIGMDFQIATCNIDANKLNHIEITIKASHRGLLKTGRIKVYTTFPLGLFMAATVPITSLPASSYF